jgi:serine/threonine protein kinase
MSPGQASPQCPQCGGSLPRQALWRAVSCSYCQAVVTLNDRWVERAGFHAAWRRARERPEGARRWMTLQGHDYELLQRLGSGDHSDAWLARRHGPAPLRAVLKLQREPGEALAREADRLRALRRLPAADAPYFRLRLPLPLAQGRGTGHGHDGAVLALHAWPGFTATLAEVLAVHPSGLGDARHAVWLWRRVLELLGYLHRHGWCHGDLRPEHWLLHPADHGVHLLGWGRAREGGDRGPDLQQSAWCMRAVLGGWTEAQPPALPARCPPALAALVERASEDRRWCRDQGADGLARQLSAAAQADFGPPRFVPFDPRRA